MHGYASGVWRSSSYMEGRACQAAAAPQAETSGVRMLPAWLDRCGAAGRRHTRMASVIGLLIQPATSMPLLLMPA